MGRAEAGLWGAGIPAQACLSVSAVFAGAPLGKAPSLPMLFAVSLLPLPFPTDLRVLVNEFLQVPMLITIPGSRSFCQKPKHRELIHLPSDSWP